jgi:hypothetical protein
MDTDELFDASFPAILCEEATLTTFSGREIGRIRESCVNPVSVSISPSRFTNMLISLFAMYASVASYNAFFRSNLRILRDRIHQAQ